MICFPHAKINLGLSIVSKRPDGFHNLETIFYPIPFRDVLELIPASETGFFRTGLPVPGRETDNLVLRAFHLLKKNHPRIASLQFHLHKVIPMGSGLGGGSSDAAETLPLVARFFDLRLSPKEFSDYAQALGSDVPFFMQSLPCFASGRGDVLEPVALDLSGYSLLLIHPEIQINTAWAFSKILPAAAKYDLKEIIGNSVQHWVNRLANDFEKPVFYEYPSLAVIKKQLYQAGAIYASMTGSGSTVFGIFPKDAKPVLHIKNAGQTFIR
jgi:4-diphosphocytidyl-2-C-methyl-D-erythritol kinase